MRSCGCPPTLLTNSHILIMCNDGWSKHAKGSSEPRILINSFKCSDYGDKKIKIKPIKFKLQSAFNCVPVIAHFETVRYE